MDQIHYNSWQKAKKEYVNIVSEDCGFRVEQLRQTTTKREKIIKEQISKTMDEKICRMKKAQLENLHRYYEEQKKLLEETIKKADIHTQLLIKGVLRIE